MYKIYLLLFLGLLQGIYAPSNEDDTESLVTLPLTLILLYNTCTYPTKIVHEARTQDGENLAGGTIFTDDYNAGQITMCAIPFVTENDSTLTWNDLRRPQQAEDEYCSYPITFGSSDLLQCAHDPEPYVTKILAITLSSPPREQFCGPQSRGRMYTFAYKTCIPKKQIRNEILQQSDISDLQYNPIKHRSQIEMYRFCYDEVNHEVLFTIHRTLSTDLLNDDRLKNERIKKHKMFATGYKHFGSVFEAIKKEYEKMEPPSADETAPSTSNPSTPSLYKAQKLVPPEDMAFYLWRKPMHHFLNVKPIRRELAELWDLINERIRKSAIQLRRKYDIYTAALTTTLLPQEIHPQGKLHVPDVWLKVIHFTNEHTIPATGKVDHQATAIILNNKFDEPLDGTFFNNVCSYNLCENAFSASFPQTGKHVKCCEVTRDIQKLLESLLMVDSTLDIGFLFDHASDSS